LTPCIKVCKLEDGVCVGCKRTQEQIRIKVCKLEDGVCVGCKRTQEQIRMWSTYTNSEREKLIKELKDD